MERDKELAAPLRELFIEELEEVAGGNPLEKLAIWQWIQEKLVTNTTHACGEEGPDNC